MRTRNSLVLLGLGAALVMALANGTASAGRLSLSERLIRVTFNKIDYAVEGLPTDTCHVTLEGSLHARSFAKTTESLVGFITRVATANCSIGTTILAASLPWHLRYVAFGGTLPDITFLTGRVVGASFNAGTLGFNCLAVANLEVNFNREGGGGITGVQIPGQVFSVRSGGGFGCPTTAGTLESDGNGSLAVLGATTRITVTLI